MARELRPHMPALPGDLIDGDGTNYGPHATRDDERETCESCGARIPDQPHAADCAEWNAARGRRYCPGCDAWTTKRRECPRCGADTMKADP